MRPSSSSLTLSSNFDSKEGDHLKVNDAKRRGGKLNFIRRTTMLRSVRSRSRLINFFPSVRLRMSHTEVDTLVIGAGEYERGGKSNRVF